MTDAAEPLSSPTSRNGAHLVSHASDQSASSPSQAQVPRAVGAVGASDSEIISDTIANVMPRPPGTEDKPAVRSAGTSDRSIHVSSSPISAGERPWPKQVVEYRRPSTKSRAEVASALPAARQVPDQGFLGRMAGLFTGGAGGRAASGAAASTSGATPDFLAQSDDPDRRRLQATAPQPSGSNALEAEWRRECLAFARVRNLAHVQEMRMLYVDAEAEGPDGAVVVVAVGAHYRPNAATREEILLHAVVVMEEVGARPYVVVYFNADADLPAIPDTSFMQELHTALDARHRDRLKALYLVHPSARLKLWVLALRLCEPVFYGRATALLRLQTLRQFLPRPPHPPQHVLDHNHG